MAIVTGRQVTATGTEPSGCVECPSAARILVGGLWLREKDIDTAADQIGHRTAASGGQLLEAASLRLRELNLRANHDYITFSVMLSHAVHTAMAAIG